MIKLLDHFEISEPNGLHLCFVLELMWMDAGTFLGGQNFLTVKMSVAKKVAQQILVGLEVLRKNGITHNGKNSAQHFLNYEQLDNC